METACDWYNFFIFEFGNPLWRGGKYPTSKSQGSKVVFSIWKKKPISGKNNIMLLTTLDFSYFMSLQRLYNLINGQSFFLIVLNKILIFRMNGSHHMFFIIQLLKQKYFLFTACDVYYLFSLWLWNEFQGSRSLFVGNENFSILWFWWGNNNLTLSYFLV